jgi:hypothetical protein
MRCGEWNHMMRASWDATLVDDAVPNPNRFDRIAGRRNPMGPKPVARPTAPYRVYNGSGVKRSTMLSNYVVHVQRCEPEKMKELEEIATELGAHVYACDPLSGPVSLVIQGKTLVRIGTNATSQTFVTCQRRDQDVVRDIWLRECYSLEALDPQATPPELRPAYMLNTSTALQKLFDSKLDIFGDSYADRFTSQAELDHILDNDDGTWEEMSMHSDGYLSNDEILEVEDDLMMQGVVCDLEEEPHSTQSENPEGVLRAPQPSWSLFADVTAILLPLEEGDQYVLALAQARLTAGGARIATTEDSSFAGTITHVVVVGNPVIDADVVLAALPIAGITSVRQRRQRRPAATWVVVSHTWVKARSERAPQLPPPVLMQPE